MHSKNRPLFREELLALQFDFLKKSFCLTDTQLEISSGRWIAAGSYNLDDETVILRPNVVDDGLKSYFKPDKFLTWEFILLHEIGHAVQHKQGRISLSSSPEGYIFESKFYPSIITFCTGEEYIKIPWEKDANDFARKNYSLLTTEFKSHYQNEPFWKKLKDKYAVRDLL